MKYQKPAGGEFGEIEIDGLLCNQMNGNGITTESVQHYQPVTCIGRFPQLQPSVSEHNFEGDSLAIDYISEVSRIARDVHHGGIDFVKRPEFVRPRINRSR